MWWVIILLGIFVIALGAKILTLGCDIEEIKNKRCDVTDCERYIDSILTKHHYSSYYDRRYTHTEEVKEKVRQVEEMCHLRNNLEKQLRLNISFRDFANRDVTIKEALEMLFKHLGLEIKPGEDVKIVKLKKNKKEVK